MGRQIALALGVWGLCFAALAIGDEPAAEEIVVCGTVVSESGEGVAGATVEAHNYWDVVETITDDEGRFALKVPSDRASMIVAGDRDQQRLGVTRVPRENVAAADDVRIELGEIKTLAVTVTDNYGEPVAGARVGVVTEYASLFRSETDERGEATLRMPAHARCSSVYARKPGTGFDYHHFESARDPAKAPGWPADGRATLTLGPTRKVEFHVSDADGAPIGDLPIQLWLLQKPDEPDSFNLSYAPGLIDATTDDAGVAVFDDLPTWHRQPFQFWHRDKRYVGQRLTCDPIQHSDGIVAVTLDRVVPLFGRVALPDASLAPDIAVMVTGAGYSFDSFRGRTTTDEDGNFQIDVWPDQLYMIAVDDSEWGAPVIDGFVVHKDTPIEGLTIHLQRATRIYGQVQVVVGPDRAPAADQSISLHQYGSDLHKLSGIELPNPEQSNKWVQPSIGRWVRTDSEGSYEFFVGPGEYVLHGPSQVEAEKFTITDEKELHFDFESPRPETGPFSGIVVDAKTGKPVAGAEIHGVYRSQRTGSELRLITDEAGRFEGTRYLHRTALFIRGPKGDVAAFLEVEPDDSQVTIELAPLGKVSGRLIDETTGQPAAKRTVSFGIRIHLGDDDAPWQYGGGGRTVTDDDGRFEYSDLVPGALYYVNIPVDATASRNAGSLQVESFESVDLGDVILKAPRPPYRPPTLEERITQALAGDNPAIKYVRALHEARSYRQHVALVLVDPETESTRELMDVRYNDTDVRRAVDNFQLVWLDATSEAVQALALKLDDAVELEDALPVLMFRDAQGAGLETAAADAISLGGSIDKTRLVDLLGANAPEPLDARAMLADALAEAAQSNRRVIVQETAVWCGPCHLLSRYLEKHRATWEKDYLWVRIDHRWKDSRQVMEQLRQRAQGGIPWTAILDANGEKLATSNDPNGNNIGFPSSPDGIEHFMQMLESSRQRLTDADLAELRAGLENR